MYNFGFNSQHLDKINLEEREKNLQTPKVNSFTNRLDAWPISSIFKSFSLSMKVSQNVPFRSGQKSFHYLLTIF